MGNLKNHARENEEMMNLNIENVSADLAEFNERCEERFSSMEVATTPGTAKVRLQGLQDKVDKMSASRAPPRELDSLCSIVIG
eukprot:6871089-Pyramimonas_sp.AAC.1